MNPKYQVFISSTFKDLIEQRNRVVETVLRMSHLPVGMEIFNSAAKTPWDVIKSHIDNSDYYVVILAHRYGTEAPDGIGYTEKEYDYAVAKGIPCLGFVLKKGVQWNPEWMESKPATMKKLEAFKRKIEANHVTYWSNPDELASQVLLGLTDTIRDTPGVGWVRASEAASSKVTEELARLSKENGELQQRLARVQETKEFHAIEQILLMEFEVDTEMGKLRISLQKVFLSVCMNQDRPDADDIYKTATGIENQDEINSYFQSIKPALDELALLGIIENTSRGTDFGHWIMTDKGTELYTELRYKGLS